MSKKNSLVSVVILLCLVFIGEACTLVFSLPTWLLPAPSAIIIDIARNYSLYLDHLLPTLIETGIGLLVAITVGIGLAILLSYSPRIHAVIAPLLVLSQTVPTIVLAPLFAIWFGFGMVSKILVVTLTCFFPITSNTLEGFTQTPQALERLFTTYKPTIAQYYHYLKIPYALPAMFSGIRIALTYSVMGALIAEWFGGEKGLGILLIRSAKSYNTVRVFAVVALVSISTLTIVWIFDRCTRHLRTWSMHRNT